MMTKLLTNFYEFECKLFRRVNQHFDRKFLNFYFRNITHIGGATATISAILFLIFLTNNSIRLTAIAAAVSLLISHIPVAIVKKLYPRKRPYIMLSETKVPQNPLEDHSFPSGHTTAIFAIIIPFIILMPALAVILLPIGASVGISRMYLGLHYPSDVLAGCFLGTSSGTIAMLSIGNYFPNAFLF